MYGNIHYDKITDDYQTTIIVYGDHDYMSASEYIVVQESLNNGEIIDEKKYWSIHPVLDKHCPCEDVYCYDREEEYYDECGRSIGYVDSRIYVVKLCNSCISSTIINSFIVAFPGS